MIYPFYAWAKECLGVCRRTAKSYADIGIVKPFRVRRMLYITQEEIDRFLTAAQQGKFN